MKLISDCQLSYDRDMDRFMNDRPLIGLLIKSTSTIISEGT